jgi:acetyl esterase/lipase
MIALVALVALTPTLAVETDILYSQAGGAELKMDITQPADWVKRPAPAVLLVHGGAWMGGQRKDMDELARMVAQNGMVAVTVSYRLAPKFKYPAMLDDVQTGVRFLRANAAKFGIDGKRIGACGASAGGHLSLLLGTTDTRDTKAVEYPRFSSRVKAVLDFFGPTDMTDTTDYPKTLDPLFMAVLGKPREQAAEDLKLASPIMYVTSDDAPVFIFQGLADPLVLPHQSRVFEAKLRSVGVPVESRYLEGVAHEVPFQKKEVREAIGAGISFLKKYL